MQAEFMAHRSEVNALFIELSLGNSFVWINAHLMTTPELVRWRDVRRIGARKDLEFLVHRRHPLCVY
jgi:hypothetical protein